MKTKILLGVVWLLMLLVAGCEANDKESLNKENETSVWELLTEEQKNYLCDTLDYSKDAIDLMSYESVNWHLLGTGLELYNPTSGVEMFGISYKDESPVADLSDSDRLITYEEAREIRLKEKDIRLNDFEQFKYEIREKDAEGYIMKMPMADYKDSYVCVYFTKKDGNIHMNVPYIMCICERTWNFSILYEYDTMQAFYEEEPKYTVQGKAFMGVQYSSVTDNSLVIYIRNWSDKNLKLSESYELYEISDGKEKFITSSEGEIEKIGAKNGGIRSVKFENGVQLVEGKTYLIKYGKEKKGYIYDEIEFTK